MPRQKSGPYRKQRIKKALKLAKGFRGGRSKLARAGREAVMRSGRYAYFGRKNKKRDYRSMWIVRINAACEMRGIAYHRFINGLKKAFDELVETAKKAIEAAAPKK
jgi:large subunit ribosomal protein L20